MANKKKLKAVQIVGRDIDRNDYSGVLTIGTKENGVNIDDINSLHRKIDSNTIIIIEAHGYVKDDGSHSILLNKEQHATTSKLLEYIQSFVSRGPIQINLVSCKPAGAKDYVKNLRAGSVIITNSKEDEVTIVSFDVLSASEIFKDYLLESNPYIRFINQLPFKAASYSSFNTKSGVFSTTPTYDALLSKDNAEKFLKSEVKSFRKFSKGKFWNGKKVKLSNVEFSEKQIDIFSKAFFLYECNTHPEFSKFLEKNLPTNEYLQEFINFFVGSFSPLNVAAGAGHYDTVRLLLENNADVNKAQNNVGTALTLAVQNGHIDVVKLLVDSGADVNKAIKDGETPLFIASRNGHIDVVKFLLESGADVNKSRDNGIGPLSVAATVGNIDIVKLLIESGADVNKFADNGATPLFIASRKGHIDVVKLLVESGADVNKSANDGRTPLRLAKNMGHTEIVNLLQKQIEELKSKSADHETLTQDDYNDLFIDDSVGEAADHADEL